MATTWRTLLLLVTSAAPATCACPNYGNHVTDQSFKKPVFSQSFHRLLPHPRPCHTLPPVLATEDSSLRALSPTHPLLPLPCPTEVRHQADPSVHPVLYVVAVPTSSSPRLWVTTCTPCCPCPAPQKRGIKLNPVSTLYHIAPCCFVFLFLPFTYIELPKIMSDTTVKINVPLLLLSASVAFGASAGVAYVDAPAAARCFRGIWRERGGRAPAVSQNRAASEASM